jgi:hypothetical protein
MIINLLNINKLFIAGTAAETPRDEGRIEGTFCHFFAKKRARKDNASAVMNGKGRSA